MSEAQFYAHFQKNLVVYKHKIMHFFKFWLQFQKFTFKAENSMKLKEILGKDVIKKLNFLHQFF